MGSTNNQELPNIVYKNFEFPYNPARTSYTIDRTYIKHKYPQLAGTELEDLGVNACVISGEGAFVGKNAYHKWRQLLQQYKKKGVGTVSHPVFTDVTRGLMTSLTGSIEPMKDYISYSFEIIADSEPSISDYISNYVNKVNDNNKTNSTKDKDSSKNKNTDTDNDGTKGKLTHTVVRGECLSVICARYAKKFNTTISWQKIAKYNNMKNPDLIYVGDKIKIYYPT